MGQVITPMVRNILLACVGGYLLQLALAPLPEIYLALWRPGHFPGEPPFRPWQLVTHAFLHADFLHLAVNSLVLLNFGPAVESLLGSRRFLVYFLTCVIAGATSQLLAGWWGLSIGDYSLGASAGISGVVLAFGLAFPRRRMAIFPIPVAMPAWVFVAGYLVTEIVLGFTRPNSGTGHFAHTGGMIGGFVLAMYWRSQASRTR